MTRRSIYIAVNEGASERTYLQSLRSFLSNRMPLGDDFCPRLDLIPKVTNGGIGGGAFPLVRKTYRLCRQADRHTPIVIWVDADIYVRNATVSERRNTQSYEFTKGGTADNSYFQGMLSVEQMRIVLAAFQGCEDVKTFSNPKVIVTSGKEAIVDMTKKFPNVVSSAKRVLNGNNNTLDVDTQIREIPGRDNLMFAHEAFFSWGVMLGVRPRILTNDLINVSIIPTISDQVDFEKPSVNDGDDIPSSRYPVIDIQRIVTEFTLKNGQTAVIGGLSKTYEYDYDNGIPYLCDIPWIGNKLFGGKTRQKEQREIIIFVTVGLADPEDFKSDTGLPKNAVLGRAYTDGTRQEPGDRTNAVEGVMSLDLRDLEDRARETKRE